MYSVCMVRVDLYLTRNEIDRLKAISKETGITMSELIRRILDEWIVKNK